MPPPTKEFLEELKERAKHTGWLHDYSEIMKFVRELYRQGGLEISYEELEPYEDEE